MAGSTVYRKMAKKNGSSSASKFSPESIRPRRNNCCKRPQKARCPLCNSVRSNCLKTKSSRNRSRDIAVRLIEGFNGRFDPLADVQRESTLVLTRTARRERIG